MSALNVLFVWHMHQPCYKDPETGEYKLPWVRLHGLKDYFDMAAILERFPNLHQTFNLTPVLLEQIEDYTESRAKDKFIDITLKKADELSISEKLFILKNFFLANWENMIKQYPRYLELLKKRGFEVDEGLLAETSRFFSTQDILDLQVLFNLVWIDPLFFERDSFLNGLKEKGGNYTEEEKVKLVDKTKEILKLIVPKYLELKNKNLIELTTSPFYHPILPLLCDTYSARESKPDIQLPKKRFRHPEDASAQIKSGIAFFKKTFGFEPEGIWPSEGSVSEGIIPLIAKEGIKWIATDEGVLVHSLNHPLKREGNGLCLEPEYLYKAYLVGSERRKLHILFRDRLLSDLIGFVYSKWNASHAASDLIDRLHRIRDRLLTRCGDSISDYAVSIILDGENPWEYYVNDGRDFLLELYGRLSEDSCLKLATVSEYLKNCRNFGTIDRLRAGSWINSNFNIWIGHKEDNTAWDFLTEARNNLIETEAKLKQKEDDSEEKSALREAWKTLFIAEGSDWCWWYGDEHSSANAEEFDELFRKNLKKVYRLIDKDPPSLLDVPIISGDKEWHPAVRPRSLIKPEIDGKVTSYYEWLSAGRLDRESHNGAMHQIEDLFKSVYYGFDLENAFFRLDFNKELVFFDMDIALAINIIEPHSIKFYFKKDPNRDLIVKEVCEDGYCKEISNSISIASQDIVEIKIPFEVINVNSRDIIKYFITLEKDGNVVERWPYKGCVSYEVPTAEFDAWNWYV